MRSRTFYSYCTVHSLSIYPALAFSSPFNATQRMGLYSSTKIPQKKKYLRLKGTCLFVHHILGKYSIIHPYYRVVPTNCPLHLSYTLLTFPQNVNVICTVSLCGNFYSNIFHRENSFFSVIPVSL